MHHNIILSVILSVFFTTFIQAQTQSIQDDFEGNGTITTWYSDDCDINTSLPNPHLQGINTSATVLEYGDVGGQFANIGFDVSNNFDLSANSIFTFKIYVPASGLTGSQPNQVSLKLQNAALGEPWSTQSEIIKPVVLDQWQTLSFDFLNDNYINLDANSPPPTQRTDFNRVVIQVNGEDNTDHVLAFIDDFSYNGTIAVDPVYDLLIWSDEFDTDGAVNPANWHHQTQLPDGANWFNGEIQHYTDRQDNSYVENGILYIVGKKETFTDQGQTKQYTSARLNSKFAFQNGKVEVRAKLPTGIGTWPAIWTLGKNIDEDGGYWDEQGFDTTPWPACGEIDIMEHWGDNQNFVQSAMHTPSSFGNTENKGGQIIPAASASFHTYSLNWYPEKMVFAVDGIVHYTYQPTVIDNNTWPFNAEQYILLNFAILPFIAPSFNEDALEIDYVRVYQESPISSSFEQKQNLFNLENIPNPAQNFTTIKYTLPENSEVKIFIQDINGRTVQTLVNEKQPVGQHQVQWNTANLSPGTYFYTLQTEDETVTKKCIINR